MPLCNNEKYKGYGKECTHRSHQGIDSDRKYIPIAEVREMLAKNQISLKNPKNCNDCTIETDKLVKTS